MGESLLVRPGCSGQPHRQLIPRAARTHLRGVLREMVRWNERVAMDIAKVDDPDVRFAIAFVLDAIADEDDCGHIRFELIANNKVRLDKLIVDDELERALSDRCGSNAVEAAVGWLRTWMSEARVRDRSLPLYWLGWRLGNLRIEGNTSGERLRIEFNHVVVDFEEGRTLGVTLWDAETLFKSTIIPFPHWREVQV